MRARWGRVALAAVAWMLLLPTAALAQPDQVGQDEVFKALQVARRPSDYVVIVDTSASMKVENRYQRVLSAVRGLLLALKPDDHVSLVTFDTTARVRYRGLVGSAPLRALKALPAKPTGKLTDIGAGIARGISELEAASAKPAGAIVLITDGKLDTAPKSPYRTVTGPAWTELRRRADTIGARHQIAAYALALDAKADAALLKRPFPKAEDIPAADLDTRLAQLDASLLRFQATEKLQRDLGQRATATVEGDLSGLGVGTAAEATLVLTSNHQYLPLVVEGLAAASSSGPAVVATGLPAQVKLAPGQSVRIPLTVTPNAVGSGELQVKATLSSPWQQVVASLGLKPATSLSASVPLTVDPSTATAPATNDAALLWPIVGGAAGIGVLALLFLLWRRTRPRMVGSLAVRRGEELIDEILLDGRTLTATRALGGTTLRVDAAAAKGRQTNSGPSVRVKADRGAGGKAVVLGDGESVEVGDLTLTYVSARSRMLELIESTGT